MADVSAAVAVLRDVCERNPTANLDVACELRDPVSMEIQDQTVVVTGGGNGIGAALCRRFHSAGAKHVAVVDVDEAAAGKIASEVDGSAHCGDVSTPEGVGRVLEEILEQQGAIDILASNAGVTQSGGVEIPDQEWTRQWNINVMSHVWGARALLPHFLERGHGYFLQTISAAGVMTEIGSAAYSATKHAAVGFAEWLSINHRRKGIGVSILCPAGVKTDFLDLEDPVHQFLHVSAVSPDEVARVAIQGIQDEQFLILPDDHEQVREFLAFKGADYDRWLHNFSRIAQRMERALAKQQQAEE